jgi:hypothetical protein
MQNDLRGGWLSSEVEPSYGQKAVVVYKNGKNARTREECLVFKDNWISERTMADVTVHDYVIRWFPIPSHEVWYLPKNKGCMFKQMHEYLGQISLALEKPCRNLKS